MAGRKSTKRASQSKRVAQLFYIFVGFLLILIGKADIMAVRTAQNDVSELFAPLFDVVSAPVRAVETMFEGVRTVASLREETVRLRAENDRLKRWQRRAEILESENRQLRTVLGAVFRRIVRPLQRGPSPPPAAAFHMPCRSCMVPISEFSAATLL